MLIIKRGGSKSSSSDFGFEPISRSIRRRLTTAIRGREFTGKTWFGFTAPPPIAYFNLDYGEDGVIQEFPTDKVIKQRIFDIPRGEIVSNPTRMIQKASPVLDELLEAYNGIVDGGSFRTVIIDKEGDLYELVRLAKLGTLDNNDVTRFQYGDVNKVMRDLIRRPLRTDVNLILIQSSKNKFSNKGKETNETEGQGFKEVASLVQATLEFEREGDRRYFTVDKCRTNSKLHGEVFEGDMFNFSTFASMAIPETEAEDWE